MRVSLFRFPVAIFHGFGPICPVTCTELPLFYPSGLLLPEWYGVRDDWAPCKGREHRLLSEGISR